MGANLALTDEELPAALAPTAPSVDPLIGARIGEFIIQERIGAGGMGVVYRAEHPLIGKRAAIKVMRAELVSPEQEQRLLVEARSVNAIRHPGVLDIFNFGTLPDGRPYVVMELLQGQSLADLMRERMEVATAVWVLDQVLAALGAAHRAGVIHRDLKPANVFLMELPDASPLIKLVDFGIAKVLQAQEGLTRADGSTLGTPDFMAPEQVRGGTVGPATDLYALGVMAFQMLTGARPFRGDNVQVMFAHVEQIPPRVSSRVEGIPPELDALVFQLMEKEPAKRPASAEVVRQQLQRMVSKPIPPARVRQETDAKAVVVEPVLHAVPAQPTAPVPARKAPPFAAAAIVGVAMLGVGYWWGSRAEVAPVGALPPPVVAEARPVASVPVEAPPPVVEAQPVSVEEGSEQEAHTEAETATETEAKSSKLPPLPLETPSEKKMARRLAGLFKLLRARSQDVDVEGELRSRLIQQYRAAAEASTEPELARVHGALDGIEKTLTDRISLHDAPPKTVAPQMPQMPPLMLPKLPTLPRSNPSEEKLAQRLDKLVAELKKKTQGQDVAPDLTKQLVAIYTSAAKATTATERMDVNQALDTWQERLKARFPN
jgi:eukaryotic-like serine/threonine-protein kinase